MKRFFILAMPRSRTAWLANFFTYGDVACLHEPSAQCASLDELEHAMAQTGADVQGSSDTANVLLFDGLIRRWPDARFLAVRRDPKEVRASLRAKYAPTEGLSGLAAAFASLTLHEGVITIGVESLSDLTMLENIWRYAGSKQPFDRRRARMLIDLNIQHNDLHRLLATVDPDRANALLSSSEVAA